MHAIARLILAAALLAAHAIAQAVPATEDEARLLFCQQNPAAAECSPPAGVLPLPPCWPANFAGTGSIIYSGSTDTGSWHYWYCPVGGKWVGVGVVLPRDFVLRHPREPRGSAAATAAAYWSLNAFKPESPDAQATEKAMLESLNRYIQWAEAPPPAGAAVCSPAGQVEQGAVETCR